MLPESNKSSTQKAFRKSSPRSRRREDQVANGARLVNGTKLMPRHQGESRWHTCPKVSSLDYVVTIVKSTIWKGNMSRYHIWKNCFNQHLLLKSLEWLHHLEVVFAHFQSNPPTTSPQGRWAGKTHKSRFFHSRASNIWRWNNHLPLQKENNVTESQLLETPKPHTLA